MIPISFEITNTLGHRFLEIDKENDCLIKIKNISDHTWTIKTDHTLQLHFRPGTLKAKVKPDVSGSTGGNSVGLKVRYSNNIIAIHLNQALDVPVGNGLELSIKHLPISALGGSRTTQVMFNVTEKSKPEALIEQVSTLELLQAASVQVFSSPVFEAEAIQYHTKFGEAKKHEYLFAIRANPTLAPYLKLRNQEFRFTKETQLRVVGAKSNSRKIWFDLKDKHKNLTGSSDAIAFSEYPKLVKTTELDLNKEGVLFTLKVKMADNHKPFSGLGDNELFLSYNNIPELPMGRIRLPFPQFAALDKDHKVLENQSSLLPTGTIVMWSGKISDIPRGWALCDGTTRGRLRIPDLREKFVRGAKYDSDHKKTDGSDSITLKKRHIPAHTHSLENGIEGCTSKMSEDGKHYHKTDPLGVNGVSANYNGKKEFWAFNSTTNSSTFETANAGKHKHTISGRTGNGTGNYLKSTPDSINILPKYYALAFIIKL